MEVAGATDIGTVRSENQDVWGVVPLGDGRVVLAVADGMGGHNGGGEAAAAAITAAMRRVEGAATDGTPSVSNLLADAVERANAAVAGVRDDLGGMPGTTLVMAVAEADSLTVANVGDSRAYLVHAGSAKLLTSDHTWVGEEILAGRLRPGAERGHPRRNVLSRAVMGDPVSADIGSHPWRRGDVLLLCSDGVWEPLSDERLGQLAATDAQLDAIARSICEAALGAGSRDNVTVVLARRVR